MAYIGKTPTVGNFQKCDAISVVNGQAAYTLQVGGSNVSPETPNHVLVSLNGVLQAPTDSYTISGSTLTFASNLATGDVIDFVMLLGNVLDLGTPSDNTVTGAKLNNDVISAQTELASEPADTDEFLVSDAGTIKRIDYSLIKGGGITEVDQFRLTANASGDADITSNLERTDNSGSTKIGTGITESSGIFSFPSTGIYLILVQASVSPYGSDTFAACRTLITLNNSSYSVVAFAASGNPGDTGAGTIPFQQGSSSFILDVTDTSNVKVKFDTSSFGGGSELRGNTDENQTSFTFVRLGDT
jgi:hypothetical protein